MSFEQVDQARASVVAAAEAFVANQAGQGYLTPFVAQKDHYPRGSNSFVLNEMLVMALAEDFTGDVTFRHAVAESMDYLLGRNPMAQSYVSGHGQRPLLNPHHRFWAHQLDSAYPPPAPGAISGGPNASIQDPRARVNLPGCTAATCFADEIQSWSTNEITINWNAPFAWVLAYLDD